MAGDERKQPIAIRHLHGQIQYGTLLHVSNITVEAVFVGKIDLVIGIKAFVRRVHARVKHGEGHIVDGFIALRQLENGIFLDMLRFLEALQRSEAGAVAHVVAVQNQVRAARPQGVSVVHIDHARRVFRTIEPVRHIIAVVGRLAHIQRSISVEVQKPHRVLILPHQLANLRLNLGRLHVIGFFGNRGDADRKRPVRLCGGAFLLANPPRGQQPVRDDRRQNKKNENQRTLRKGEKPSPPSHTLTPASFSTVYRNA